MRDTTGDGSEPVPPASAAARLDGRHVLMMLFAFFGVIFAVNGYFLFSALSTHTGVVAVEPYRKGLAYNHADRRRRTAGGARLEGTSGRRRRRQRRSSR